MSLLSMIFCSGINAGVTTTNLTPLAQQNNNAAGDYQETSASSSSRHPAALMNMVSVEPIWIPVLRIHEILGSDPDPRIQTTD
jgi:hypothetical protein